MEKCGSSCHCIIEPLPIIEKAAEKLRIFSSLFFGSDTATPPPEKKKEWKKMPGWGHFSSRGSPQEPHFPICPPPLASVFGQRPGLCTAL